MCILPGFVQAIWGGARPGKVGLRASPSQPRRSSGARTFAFRGLTRKVSASLLLLVFVAVALPGAGTPAGKATPNFSLSLSNPSLSVVPGTTAHTTVSVGALNGFTGAVSLAVSGLPSGAAASFSPTSISPSETSKLKIAVSSSTPGGSYTLTVSGTIGSLTHTAQLTLTVEAPDFSLSLSNPSLSVVQGTTARTTVSVGALNGFTGAVSLAVDRKSVV